MIPIHCKAPEEVHSYGHNQSQLRSNNTAPKYKNGFEVQQTYEQAMKLDAKNGNKKWQDAVDT
jgi:hypothetical protein